MDVKYPQVTVELSGQDGNAINIIGRVSRALRREVGPDAATEFSKAALACESYDALVTLAMTTVEVV